MVGSQHRWTRVVRLGSVAIATLLIACSGGDPREANLRQGMRDMAANIRSATYKDLLQKAGSSTASAGVRVLFSGAAAVNWKEPPEGIGFSPDEPTKPWIVVVRGDDGEQAIVLEGYGEDTAKPLMTERLHYPPD
jgi:hypothetical protein